MNKNFLTVLIVVAVGILFLALVSRNKKNQNLEETMSPHEAQLTEDIITVGLSEQNDSGESGTAVLEEGEGSVLVTLNLENVPEGATQPAHIHSGACPNPGPVVYPLNFPVDGYSETTLDISLEDLRAKMPLAINVHKSAAEAGTYVSCGDISL